MLYIETNMASYETIRRSLDAVYPEAKTEHITTDHALKALGFIDYPPCVFSLDMTWDEYNRMMDELMQVEVDAFNTEDGKMPAEDDEYYQKYLEHGWLWDLFFNADDRGNITEK